MTSFIDIHCHPVVKFYLFDGRLTHSLFIDSNGHPDNNYMNRQVTVPAMREAGINAVIAAHLLPEKFIDTEWTRVDWLIGLLKFFCRKLRDKIEGSDAFSRIIEMIENFEEYISAHTPEATIAHNYTQLSDALASNTPVFVHAIEGGHHLGRDLDLSNYLKRIEIFKKKGVAIFTIGHWFPNNIVSPCEGIPPNTKIKLGMRRTAEEIPMGALGIAVVKAILESGIILDLTHTNEIARGQIYEINTARGNNKRPLVFSHVGVRYLFNDPDNPDFGKMNPTDDELKNIRDCKGVVGVIFMNYWLTGVDEDPGSDQDFGFDAIVQTIRHIATVTGSFDYIAIGTDFDGLNDPPDDYVDTASLGTFKSNLIAELGGSGVQLEDINKILGGNIMRVLQQGWVGGDV